ncbi:MAG: GNAT family N-acetyltransferase [Lachnospiraceae bacterium]|nr:GNAT family N-acetyltransferase [Lachnospiraceae bacterium]
MKEASKDLQLYIPHPEDGWFYVKMMSDPETMAYNAPWFPPDGCIPEPEKEWQEMQRSWIGQEPVRFYAFLQRRSDGAFVGDVNYHYNPNKDWCDMGIVIYAPERVKGYGRQGLELLLERAFKADGVACLHNDFEPKREAAYHIHKAVGFRDKGMVDGIIQLELTREDYLKGTESMNTVRRAEKRDIPRIMELLVQVNMVHHNGRPDIFKGPTTKYTADELAAILEDDRTPVFVCVDENDKVLGHGFCIYKEVSGDQLLSDIKTLYIDDICVDEAARGLGIGRALYEYIKDFARENGFYNITLNVWSCNPGAIRFYESMGLKPQKIGMEEIL